MAVGATPYGPTLADAPETRLGEGIVGRVALENRVLMVSDIQAHPDIPPYRKRRAAGAGINAMLCVPVCGPHHVLGVLSSTSKQRRVFTDDEAMVLSAYTEQVAIAIEHALTIQGFLDLLESRCMEGVFGSNLPGRGTAVPSVSPCRAPPPARQRGLLL